MEELFAEQLFVEDRWVMASWERSVDRGGVCEERLSAVQLHDVDFAYPRSDYRLRIPEWDLAAGRHVAVIGPSGSGKTTLLQLLAGILLPQRGEITVDGICVSSLADPERRRFRLSRIGFVFQDFQLIDYLNVLENIMLPCRIGHPELTVETARQRAVELVEMVGIGDKLKRNVNRLSHGERQRVALCRALVGTPRVILADEPTGNLDPRGKERIVELLHEHARRLEATLIFVTHDRQLLGEMDEVVDFAHWVQ